MRAGAAALAAAGTVIDAGNVVVVVESVTATATGALVVVGSGLATAGTMATVVVGAAVGGGADLVATAAVGITSCSPTGTRFGLLIRLAAASACTVTLNVRAARLRLSPRRSTFR